MSDIFGGLYGMGDATAPSEDPTRAPSVTHETVLPETVVRGDVPGGDTMSTLTMVLGYIGMTAGAYHGYKRVPKHKVWGAIGYGLLGSFWFIGLPVILIQGFGKPKGR